jgi:hypothetical protein
MLQNIIAALIREQILGLARRVAINFTKEYLIVRSPFDLACFGSILCKATRIIARYLH